MVEIGIAQLLASTPIVIGLVGSRIYPLTLPSDALVLPAVTYQVVSASAEYTLAGALIGEKRLQVDCWGARYLDAKNVQLVILQTLVGFAGLLPNGYGVRSVAQGMELDSFENDARIYRCMVEFEIGYSF